MKNKLALLKHLNKHRPRIAEIYSHLVIGNDADEVREFLNNTQHLFKSYWEIERELFDAFYYSGFLPLKARRSRKISDAYIAHLKDFLDVGLINQKRFDVLITPLLAAPSYRRKVDLLFILDKINIYAKK